MATAGMRMEPSRDLLSQVIVESLNSWTEIQRRIFIDIHYGGRSIDEVSRSLGMKQSDIRQTLECCERRLFRALKIFRDGASGDVSTEPPHPVIYAGSGCRL